MATNKDNASPSAPLLWRWHRRWHTPADLWERQIAPRAIPEPNSGCWLWEGVADPHGRAKFKVDGNVYSVSRVACVVFHGASDINDSTWFACHRCGTKNCVNPAHIYVGDKSSNMYDDYRLGVRPVGSTAATHCHRGHAFTDENTHHARRPNGRTWRSCRACAVIKQRAYLERRSAA